MNERLPTARPWWREPMMWLVLGGPSLVVVAGIATAVIAWQGADRLLAEPPAAAAPTRRCSRL